MTIQLTSSIDQAINDLFAKEGWPVDGLYRGYKLLGWSITPEFNKITLTAYMRGSPLSPRDMLAVWGELADDLDPTMTALNAILSLKRLVDKAYQDPESVPEL